MQRENRHNLRWKLGRMMGRGVWILGFVGLLATAVFMMAIVPASYAQLDPTATPDADGIIYDTVRDGDTMYAVSFRNGITLDELLTFNGISATDFIHPGDKLIVGYGTPEATATSDVLPTVTPTRPPPTPMNTAVPPPPTKICLMAYVDANVNGLFDAGEGLQTAVAITIFTPQTVIVNYITDGVSEPYCTMDLPPGEYQVTRSILQGETLTTSGNRTVLLQTGDVVTLQFGGTMAAVLATPNGSAVDTAVNPLPAVTATNVTIGTGSTFDQPTAQAPQTADTQNQSSLIAIGVVIIGSMFLGGAIIFVLRLRKD